MNSATVSLQSGMTFGDPVEAALSLLVFSLLSVLAAGALTVAYRWYFKTLIPEGVSILAGVATVALFINTASLGVVVNEGSVDLFRPGVVFFNVVALGVSTVAAPVGRRVGDAAASKLFSAVGVSQRNGEMSAMVRSVGRLTSVVLPEEIDDMESYDPVSEETKAELAGKTLVFPRGLTVDDLRSRLSNRLKEDYAIGYVDIDLTDEGTVEYLAVGSRAAGVGATIAPGTVAVAVRADPPNNAASGDLVSVWSAGTADEPPTQITTAELRGVAGDVVTLAVDEADAALLSSTTQYRLVVLPAEPQADREFATLLRSVDETMASVTVGAESELIGETPESLATTVLAIRRGSEKLLALPPREQTFAAGDSLYVLGRPDVLRRLEARATTMRQSTPETVDDSDGKTGKDSVETT